MEKIHILTDSSADIPQAQVEAHGIEIVPITLTHEGRTIREYYDITPEEYWKLLEDSREIPVTAMVTPTVFLDSYRRAAERGCTHCSRCSSTETARAPIRRRALRATCSARKRATACASR